MSLHSGEDGKLIIERKKKIVSLKIILPYTHQEKKESQQRKEGRSKAGGKSRKRLNAQPGCTVLCKPVRQGRELRRQKVKLSPHWLIFAFMVIL